MADDDELFYTDEKEEQIGLLKRPWKIMLVDDEPSVHQITLLCLNMVEFEQRPLKFYHCYSAAEAKKILAEESDIAVVLLDIVMETELAGLDVAKYIRETLNNHLVRIILRTGQPGSAPEEDVIVNYDINDYKNKTELTSTKLFTSVISALRSYQEFSKSELQHKALTKMLSSSESMLNMASKHRFLDNLVPNMRKILSLAQQFELLPIVISLIEYDQNNSEMKELSILRQSNNVSQQTNALPAYFKSLSSCPQLVSLGNLLMVKLHYSMSVLVPLKKKAKQFT